jgi:acyl transferase domain-containing protein
MEKIAIIGAGCKYGGGANDMRSFWKMMLNGVDAVELIPPDRWDWEKYLAAICDRIVNMK